MQNHQSDSLAPGATDNCPPRSLAIDRLRRLGLLLNFILGLAAVIIPLLVLGYVVYVVSSAPS